MQITGVSLAAFDNLRSQLVQNHQAEVTGTTQGTITGHGVTANYRYDSAGQTLSVDVIHHPFYIPVSVIESQLHSAITGCQKPN
ncbi:MAG TPA: hypothetical protein VGL72_32130 [Bryobacteraceae bacterium]|jgi:hypothetical protein